MCVEMHSACHMNDCHMNEASTDGHSPYLRPTWGCTCLTQSCLPILSFVFLSTLNQFFQMTSSLTLINRQITSSLTRINRQHTLGVGIRVTRLVRIRPIPTHTYTLLYTYTYLHIHVLLFNPYAAYHDHPYACQGK